MNRKISWVAALTIAFVTGCGAARPSMYYQLTVPPEMASAAAHSPYDVTLLIGPMRASHLYREDHIVYGSNDEHMGTYQYQLWAEPPSEMLQDVLVRELRSSGRFHTVDALRSNSRGDYVLYGRLYDFKELSGDPLSTRIAFDLELRQTKTGTTVWTHSYTHDEPAGGKDISAVVAALNRNAQRGVGDTISSLDQYFSTHPAN